MNTLGMAEKLPLAGCFFNSLPGAINGKRRRRGCPALSLQGISQRRDALKGEER